MSRAKYTSTAASVPNCVTAVNDAPASPAKKTRDTIARWPDEDTGRNSVRPCTMAKMTTCHHDIAGTAFTTTTVPGGYAEQLCDRNYLEASARATASRTAAHRLRSSVMSTSTTLRRAVATTSSGCGTGPLSCGRYTSTSRC